jgi:sigma-B regulation protein RsbU (phosphoserine phosphatase)
MLYQNLRLRMGRDDHATLTMLSFFSDGRLTYAGAHEDIIVCGKGGEVRTILTHGTWVGISEDISHDLESRTLQLAEDDLVVLYTDGIPEARRGHECFGMPRLIAESRETPRPARRRNPERHHATVFDYGPGSLQDDATMLVLRYAPGAR